MVAILDQPLQTVAEKESLAARFRVQPVRQQFWCFARKKTKTSNPGSKDPQMSKRTDNDKKCTLIKLEWKRLTSPGSCVVNEE